MANRQQIKSLVDQMPDPDRRGMYTQNIDDDKIEKAVAELYAGGGASLKELIGLLDEPGSVENAKPHYALHCVINRALIGKDEQKRREFCLAMAACLSEDLSDDNKAYLIQELQWAGGEEVVAALGTLLLNERLVEPATMALVAIGRAGIPPLLAALPRATGNCRLNVIHGLAALEAEAAATALTDALSDPDRETRLAAAAGLARLGDESSVDRLLQAADVEPGWERIRNTKHCLVLAETLLKAGKQEPARRIYRHLSKTRTDPSESYVRFIATMALTE
jgi:hypothetical protein